MSLRRILRVHDAVLGRSSARGWSRMVEHLRADPDGRACYDRATAVIRALEQREIAGSEIDLVERWLEHDGVLDERHTREGTRAWTWIGIAFGFAAAAVLALRVVPPDPSGDELRAKGGGYARPLGLQLLCDDGHGAGGELRELTAGGCPNDAALSFAIRVDERYTGGAALSLFGIDAQGEVLYYVPVPDDAELPTLVHGRWQALDRAVQLSVNHRVGPVRVYALLAPAAAQARAPLDAIDDAAAALAHAPAAGPGEPPWHERLAGTGPLLSACGVPGQCASAELEFRVDPPAADPRGARAVGDPP
jgi:hypothetical protein